MFNLGFDGGYGSCKNSAGASWEKIFSFMLPSGVVRTEEVGETVTGERTGVEVEVGGVRYLAGVSQIMTGGQRVMHDDYPRTDEYLALYIASLHTAAKKGGQTVFDSVVTGLPSFQFPDEDLKQYIRDRLSGTFFCDGRELVVKKVKVTAQPIGAFTAFLFANPQFRDMIKSAKVLVVDVGTVTADFAVVASGVIDKASCTSSKNACSVALARLQTLFKERHGRMVDVERFEHALRDGKGKIFSGMEEYPIADLLNEAASETMRAMLAECQNAIRRSGAQPDLVLLAGGGAPLAEKQARLVFPQSKILLAAKDPVMANSRGYFCLS